jgi:archaellum component FlaC
MVQADISQLSAECSTWREQLRKFRDEFMQHETRLTRAAGQPLSNEQLQQVEHLHNQFHIQLINIHDLKQAIKVHQRKMNFEISVFNNSVNEESLSYHESLFDEYQSLTATLEELSNKFNHFLKRTREELV